MYRYSLTNSSRTDCPFCGKEGKYSGFINNKTKELAPIEYGMCSSCQKYKRPTDNLTFSESSYTQQETVGYFESDRISLDIINQYHTIDTWIGNNFLEGLIKKFGFEEAIRVYDLFKLGRFPDNKVGTSSAIIFPYLYTDDQCCSAKLMWYNEGLKRIKEGKKSKPRFFHNLHYWDDWGQLYDFNMYENDDKGVKTVIPFKLKLCLFGHHQIINDKDKAICLVESEKTAVIMSIVMPEYIWVASGGKNLIQNYKFLFFKRRKCFAFPDLSSDDNVYNYWNDKLTFYNQKFGYDIQFVDYIPEVEDEYEEMTVKVYKEMGDDIADFALNSTELNKYINYIRNKLEK